MRRLGLVDSEGLPVDPTRLVCLRGKDPVHVAARLERLGYRHVTPGGRPHEYIDDRGRTQRTSWIYRYDEPHSDTVHFVRIDEEGHNVPPGFAGAHPHYHVDTCSRSKFARDNNGNVVKNSETGQPMRQDQHYEQDYEPGAQSYNDSHEPVSNPNNPYQDASAAAPDTNTWASETHLHM